MGPRRSAGDRRAGCRRAARAQDDHRGPGAGEGDSYFSQEGGDARGQVGVGGFQHQGGNSRVRRRRVQGDGRAHRAAPEDDGRIGPGAIAHPVDPGADVAASAARMTSDCPGCAPGLAHRAGGRTSRALPCASPRFPEGRSNSRRTRGGSWPGPSRFPPRPRQAPRRVVPSSATTSIGSQGGGSGGSVFEPTAGDDQRPGPPLDDRQGKAAARPESEGQEGRRPSGPSRGRHRQGVGGGASRKPRAARPVGVQVRRIAPRRQVRRTACPRLSDGASGSRGLADARRWLATTIDRSAQR